MTEKLNALAQDEFTKGYLDAALWTSMDESTPSGGFPLDKNYTTLDIAQPTLRKMIADCNRFQGDRSIEGDFENNARQAGVDFWLTRNGHGAGFWDGGWPREAGARLTLASKKFGEFNLYVGDDKLIHGS